MHTKQKPTTWFPNQVEYNNNSPLQQGTPIKQTGWSHKGKAQNEGGICSWLYTPERITLLLESIDSQKFVSSLLQLPNTGVAGATSGKFEGKILRTNGPGSC